jgi:hypothetical protein
MPETVITPLGPKIPLRGLDMEGANCVESRLFQQYRADILK